MQHSFQRLFIGQAVLRPNLDQRRFGQAAIPHEKTTNEPQKTVPERTKLMTAAVPKTDYVPTNKKNPFTQRRSGG